MVSSTSPLETEFTLVIDVSKGIWSKFTSANYASALIEAAAGTTDFITGWQKTKIDLTPFPHVPGNSSQIPLPATWLMVNSYRDFFGSR